MAEGYAITACPKCFTYLRVPVDRLGQPTSCSHCGDVFRPTALQKRSLEEAEPEGYEPGADPEAPISFNRQPETPAAGAEAKPRPVMAPGCSKAVTYGVLSLVVVPLSPLFSLLALSEAQQIRTAVRRGRGRYRGLEAASLASALAWVSFILFVACVVLGLLWARTHVRPREVTQKIVLPPDAKK